MTLQKVALSRVQARNLGVKINIPKGSLRYEQTIVACDSEVNLKVNENNTNALINLVLL